MAKKRMLGARRGLSLALCAAVLLSQAAVTVWAAGEEEESVPDLTIGTAEELWAFASDVNSGQDYNGKLVVLEADIDLSAVDSEEKPGGEEETPGGEEETPGGEEETPGGEEETPGGEEETPGGEEETPEGEEETPEGEEETPEGEEETPDGQTDLDDVPELKSEPEPEPEPTMEFWTPIGTAAAPFKGTFDGQRHTVSGLNIDSEADDQGLFGYVSGGELRNVTVAGTVKSTGSHVGGVVGYLSGNISGCVNQAAVTGGDYTGGVVGCQAGRKATIMKCGNLGTVTGTGSCTGGVAGGLTTSNITLTGCYNAGTVSGSEAGYTGGIAGDEYNSSINLINSSFNVGTVNGGAACGAIRGDSGKGKVTGCYSTALEVTLADADYVTIVDRYILTTGELAWLLNTANGTADNSGIWGQGEGYPVPAENANSAIYRVIITGTGGSYVTVEREYVTPDTEVLITVDDSTFESTKVLNRLQATAADGTVLMNNPFGRNFIMPAGDVTLSADIITVNPDEIYTIILHGDGGYFGSPGTDTYTIQANGGVRLGADALSMETLELVNNYETETMHYLCTGWYTDPAYTYLYDVNSVVYSDLHLYAKWQLQVEVTVTFDLNRASGAMGSETPPPQIALAGDLVKNPGNPIWNSDIVGGLLCVHTFQGWYTAASGGEKWDFSTSTLPVDGSTELTLYAQWENTYDFDGADVDVVEIENEDMLVQLAEHMSSDGYEGLVFMLTNDLEMTEPVSIGTTAAPFQGTFLGDGYTIAVSPRIPRGGYSLGYTHQTLFNSVGDSAVISGLNVLYESEYDDSVLAENEFVSDWGDIAGIAKYNDGTIEDCHVTMKLSLSSEDTELKAANSSSDTGTEVGISRTKIAPIGGIVLYNNGVLKNCSLESGSSLEITEASMAGIAYSNTGTIENCYTAAGTALSLPVDTDGMKDGYLAGIAVTNSGTISGCVNQSEITAIREHMGNLGRRYNLAGGIVASNSGSITSCMNTGNVTVQRAVGGIAGQNTGTISECVNHGDIKGGCSNANGDTGGIVGYNTGSGTVQRCYSSGEVSYKTLYETFGRFGIGGVAGRNTGSITTCYAAGSVSDDGGMAHFVGGVVGRVQDSYYPNEIYTGTVTNCYWFGPSMSVALGGSIGPIVGDKGAVITDCCYGFSGSESVKFNAENSGTVELTAEDFNNGYAAWLLDGGTEHKGIWTMNYDLADDSEENADGEETAGSDEETGEEEPQKSGAPEIDLTENSLDHPVLGEGSVYQLSVYFTESTNCPNTGANENEDKFTVTVGEKKWAWNAWAEESPVYIPGGATLDWTISGFLLSYDVADWLEWNSSYWEISYQYSMSIKDVGANVILEEYEREIPNNSMDSGTYTVPNGTDLRIDAVMYVDANYEEEPDPEPAPDPEPEAKPEPKPSGDGGQGTGSGQGIGSGTGTGSGLPGGEKGGSGQHGTGEKTTVSEIVTMVPTDTPSDAVMEELPIQIAEVAEVTQVEDDPVEETKTEKLEPDEQPEGGSPKIEEPEEPEEPEEEEEPEEPEEPRELTILELVVETVRDNPLPSILVALVVLGVILLGGLRRVKKAKQEV